MHPNPKTGVPIKGGKFINKCTGEKAREDRGRGCIAASTSCRMPRNAKDCWQYQKLEEVRRDLAREPSERLWPC